VEIQAEGTDEAVEALTVWCREGPPGARVRQVVVNPAASGAWCQFSIRY
jgi:acylphosphatase